MTWHIKGAQNIEKGQAGGGQGPTQQVATLGQYH